MNDVSFRIEVPGDDRTARVFLRESSGDFEGRVSWGEESDDYGKSEFSFQWKPSKNEPNWAQLMQITEANFNVQVLPFVQAVAMKLDNTLRRFRSTGHWEKQS